MSSRGASTSSSGIGFAGLLTLIFITLKLLGRIDWSWWWVLSPIWISLALGFVIVGTILAGWIIIELARV